MTDQKWQVPSAYRRHDLSTPDEAADWVAEIKGMCMGALNMDNRAKDAAEAGNLGEGAFL